MQHPTKEEVQKVLDEVGQYFVEKDPAAMRPDVRKSYWRLVRNRLLLRGQVYFPAFIPAEARKEISGRMNRELARIAAEVLQEHDIQLRNPFDKEGRF